MCKILSQTIFHWKTLCNKVLPKALFLFCSVEKEKEIRICHVKNLGLYPEEHSNAALGNFLVFAYICEIETTFETTSVREPGLNWADKLMENTRSRDSIPFMDCVVG
jgi:hypothetical protein